MANSKNIKDYLKEIKAYKDVLLQLVRQQLILRYRRTVFGYLWTLLNPILMMSVTAVVFASLFKADLKTFAVFLFAGMIPWNFFSSTVTQATTSFINNESLIKKIYLPRLLFPLSVAIGILIDSLLSFLALFIIMLVIGAPFSMSLLFIPIAYVLLFFFSFGIAIVFSIATVFFRDLQYVIGIAMQALFFLTPVLYKSEALAGKVAWLIKINPVATYIELFRAPLYTASLPSFSVIIHGVFLALVSMVFGMIIFMKQEKKIVFRL